MFDVLIVAAGKGTRFESNVPKALQIVLGQENLRRNVDILRRNKMIGKIYCTVRTDERHLYIGYDDVQFINISESFGSGHAVLYSMLDIDIDNNFGEEILSKRFIILWGDAIISSDEYVSEILSMDFENRMMYIPCQLENYPYVCFDVDSDFVVKGFKHSKYCDDMPDFGWHDMSTFICDREMLKDSLLRIMMIGDPRDEFEFLEVLHLEMLHTNNERKSKIFPVHNRVESFNTVWQLELAKDALNEHNC